MKALILNTLLEKIRRKEIYIFVFVGLLLLLFLSSNGTSISVGGEPITGFHQMFPVIMVVLNAVICLLTLVLSLSTIPNEYRRKTSHLVWIRGISQERYHFALTLANFLAASVGVLILMVALSVLMIAKGQAVLLPRLFLAYPVLLLNVAATAMVSGVLSVKCSPMAAGFLSLLLILSGILSPVMDMIRFMVSGLPSVLLRVLLWLAPKLDTVRAVSAQWIVSGELPLNGLFQAGLWIFVVGLGFLVLKRKEA